MKIIGILIVMFYLWAMPRDVKFKMEKFKKEISDDHQR